MNVNTICTLLYDRTYSVQIVFNVHNSVKLKILTVNPYTYLHVYLEYNCVYIYLSKRSRIMVHVYLIV